MPGRGLALVVLLVGVALSVGLGIAARREIERSAQQRFDVAATDLARRIEDRFDAYTDVLIGLRALFNTTGTVSRLQFRRYVDALAVKSNYPGFRVLNYAPYVAAGERAAFEDRLHGDVELSPMVARQTAIAPSGDRADYHPLALIEPLAGNENLIGRDIAAVPEVRRALEQARDTGGLTSSGRRIKVNRQESETGLAIRLPVYRPQVPLETAEQRRAAYIGSVGAGFSIDGLMRDLALAGGGIRLRLYDAGVRDAAMGARVNARIVEPPPLADDRLLFDTASVLVGAGKDRAGSPPDYLRTLAFDLGGRSWIVEASGDAGLGASPLDRAIPWLIVACGMAMSLLLAGVVYSLATARGRAQAIASAMTRHLRTSERQLEEAQRLAQLGSWILDPEGGALFCSDEATRIFGFVPGAGVPGLPALLARVPDDERTAVQQHIDVASRTDERREFEHRVVLTNGAERWVHAIVQRTQEHGRHVLRGTVRDDTQRHKGAVRLALEHEIARLLVSDSEPELVMGRAIEAVC
ncbi:MAG: CHASE domain-containing protein, partial [Rhizobacter sp.]